MPIPRMGFFIAPIIAVLTFFLWVTLQIVQRGSDVRPAPRQSPSRNNNSVKLKRQK